MEKQAQPGRVALTSSAPQAEPALSFLFTFQVNSQAHLRPFPAWPSSRGFSLPLQITQPKKRPSILQPLFTHWASHGGYGLVLYLFLCLLRWNAMSLCSRHLSVCPYFQHQRQHLDVRPVWTGVTSRLFRGPWQEDYKSEAFLALTGAQGRWNKTLTQKFKSKCKGHSIRVKNLPMCGALGSIARSGKKIK